MAIIHYDVTFVKCPSLNQIKDKLDSRMGLRTHLVKDSIEGCHEWPHIGQVRESGTFECDECDDSDLEVTVGSSGVRISCVPSSTHPYFRESALAALIDLGAPSTPSCTRTSPSDGPSFLRRRSRSAGGRSR